MYFCHTTSTVQLEKLTWQKEKEREKGFLILHPKLPSHSQIKIQLTLFSPCRLWRSSLYSALKFATMHTHWSPFHQTMQSKAKRSIFFCFFVSMAKDVLLEEGLCCASVYFCHMILRRETKMCGVVVNDVHMSSFTWAVEIGFTYYVQKEFSG